MTPKPIETTRRSFTAVSTKETQMSYTINFVGLVCFIEQTGGGFLAALPDGKNVILPSGKHLAPHSAYLIARTNDINETSVTPPWSLFIRDKMVFFDITGCVLNFTTANTPGTIDKQQFTDEIYNWDELDPKFKVKDKTKPKNAAATVALRQGIFHARRMPKHEALIGQVDLAPAGAEIKVTTDVRFIKFKNESDIIIANVSKAFAENNIPDTDPDDFRIYYTIDESGGTPSGKLPTAQMQVPESTSLHPFIAPGRDLHVACSPILRS